MFDGEIEVDASYFGGHRKGKRGRGAAGKISVFGLLKPGGKVYARVIPGARGSSTLVPFIARKVNGVPKDHFELCLKECEWPFNTPDPKRQLVHLKLWVRRNMG